MFNRGGEIGSHPVLGIAMDRMRSTTLAGLVVASCLVSAAIAESRKEFRFTLNPRERANVSVETRHGAITVKPGSALHVSVVAIVQDKAQVDHLQKGNRVEIESQLQPDANKETGRIDYELTVPPNATVSVRSATGPITVEGLHGDLTLEDTEGAIEVRNSGGGHVHVNSMSGPVSLTEVRNGHIEITSISGDIHLNSVTGPKVQVNSGSGKIFYDGDFGLGGDYMLSSYSGDIEAFVPAGASADFNAHSMQGQAQSEVHLVPSERPRFPNDVGRSFFGTVGKAASEVVFKSITGRIRLNKR